MMAKEHRMKIDLRCVEILGELADVFEQLDSKSINRFVGYLLKARRIFFIAAGRSRRMAEAFVIRLSQLGLKASMAGETSTGRATKGDLVVAVSRSGQTNSINAIARRADADGALVCAVTSARRSSLVRTARHVFYLAADGGKQYGGALFEQAFLILADGIFMELRERAGLSEADLDRMHTNLE